VALGDEKTLLPIIGYGVVDFSMQQKHIRLKAFYVPTLVINLYSPTEHIKFQNYTYTLAHNKMLVHYQGFKLAITSNDQFTCNITPIEKNCNQSISFDFTQAEPSTGHDTEEVKLKHLHPSAFIPLGQHLGLFDYM
jgi:hypothetical protein